MQKLQKRLLNRLRHLVEEAEKLRDRVEELCPAEYRVGHAVDESDFLASDWNLAHCASHDLADSLDNIALMLDAESN